MYCSCILGNHSLWSHSTWKFGMNIFLCQLQCYYNIELYLAEYLYETRSEKVIEATIKLTNFSPIELKIERKF